MTSSGEHNPYAVFLSYNADDRSTVEKIAAYLADKAELHPWFDHWRIIPGEPFVSSSSQATRGSTSGPAGSKTTTRCGVWSAASGAVTCVAYSADGSMVVTGGADRTVKLWWAG